MFVVGRAELVDLRVGKAKSLVLKLKGRDDGLGIHSTSLQRAEHMLIPLEGSLLDFVKNTRDTGIRGVLRPSGLDDFASFRIIKPKVLVFEGMVVVLPGEAREEEGGVVRGGSKQEGKLSIRVFGDPVMQNKDAIEAAENPCRANPIIAPREASLLGGKVDKAMGINNFPKSGQGRGDFERATS